MQLAAVKRHSLVEEVCDRLAEAIRSGLAAGGRLPSERRLAEQFGVSRPVVREATKRLEQQGLLEVRQGVGIRAVDRLHAPVAAAARLLLPEEPERLRQSLEVRAALEPEIASRAAERVAGKDTAAVGGVERMREVHREMEAAVELESALELDLAFHRELARLAGNEIFGLVLDSLAELGRESRRATISRAGVERALGQHAAVLAAVEAGNAPRARAAMRHHLAAAVEDLVGRPLKPNKSVPNSQS